MNRACFTNIGSVGGGYFHRVKVSTALLRELDCHAYPQKQAEDIFVISFYLT